MTIIDSLFTEQKFDQANIFSRDIDVAAAIGNGDPCPWLLLATGGTIGAGCDNPFVQAISCSLTSSFALRISALPSRYQTGELI